jgi:hypothetical protein
MSHELRVMETKATDIHTLHIRNTYCFSVATIVSLKIVNVTLINALPIVRDHIPFVVIL